ncbi:hypothetical protein UFOVP1290_288 [uncultured Caudovirales phage]|uniref:Uncharacterized protein n=1 Tax=uncultured Caudovirales phage TaxID=2100421 RepID=A0A6J5RT44_9CAUD|nr:hypothetical protein UFOVP1290_288 [uncultured Caudovirales phage]
MEMDNVTMSLFQFIKQFFIKDKPAIGSKWRVTYPCSIVRDNGICFILDAGTIITIISNSDTTYYNCAYVVVDINGIHGEIRLELWQDKEYPMIKVSK